MLTYVLTESELLPIRYRQANGGKFVYNKHAENDSREDILRTTANK